MFVHRVLTFFFVLTTSFVLTSYTFAAPSPQESTSTIASTQDGSPNLKSPTKEDEIPVSLPPELEPSSAVPVASELAPKLQKELSKALDALRYDRLDEAQNHLDTAFKLAPANAHVDYARGLLAERLYDPSGAQSWWKKSIALDPSYTLAMLALGQLLAKRGDLDNAEAYVQKARAMDPYAWRPYALLSIVNLGRHSYADAVTFAEQSLTLGKNKANSARLPLAEALIALDNRDSARETLSAFIQAKPPSDQLVLAQRFLKSLQTGPDTFITDSSNLSSSSVPGGSKFYFAELPLIPLGFPSWIPSNVDDSVPLVEVGTTCPLPNVLEGASRNVQKFVKSVDHFTATETLDHELVDDWGLASRREKRKFNYVVDISEPRHGNLNVEEYRNGTTDIRQFPDGIATLGLPSIVLLFHPYFRDNYEISCEGLGHWHNSEAWQLRFIQRPGKPSLRDYRMGVTGPSTPVPLKGRVWIDKRNLQVVRIESDLVSPLPSIKLAAEHQDIEFAPVKFRKLREPMWLPATANIYFDLRGRKFLRRNSFTDYFLFSVDDRQEISAPKETAASGDTPSTQNESSKP